MKMRKADTKIIVNAAIVLQKSDIKFQLQQLETAYLANQNLENIINGLLTAKKHNIPLTLEQAIQADKDHKNIPDEIKNKTTTPA